MMLPKVTVITVVYNAVQTIEATIQSVLQQSYPNLEYIIIDGGSGDGTIEIIRKYVDRIAYWISEPDRGIYDAMNKGIRLANGDWVNFMNAGDTFFNSDTLLLLQQAFSDDSVSVVYGDNISVFSWGKYLVKAYDLRRILTNGITFCHQSSFVNRKVLQNICFDLNYKICADYNLFYQLYIRNYKFLYMPIPICSFMADGFASQNYIRFYKEQLKIRGKNRTIGDVCKIIEKYLYSIALKIMPNVLIDYIRKKRYSKDPNMIFIS